MFLFSSTTPTDDISLSLFTVDDATDPDSLTTTAVDAVDGAIPTSSAEAEFVTIVKAKADENKSTPTKPRLDFLSEPCQLFLLSIKCNFLLPYIIVLLNLDKAVTSSIIQKNKNYLKP